MEQTYSEQELQQAITEAVINRLEEVKEMLDYSSEIVKVEGFIERIKANN